MGCSRHMDN
jgi:hypothetical protein